MSEHSVIPKAVLLRLQCSHTFAFNVHTSPRYSSCAILHNGKMRENRVASQNRWASLEWRAEFICSDTSQAFHARIFDSHSHFSHCMVFFRFWWPAECVDSLMFCTADSFKPNISHQNISVSHANARNS